MKIKCLAHNCWHKLDVQLVFAKMVMIMGIVTNDEDDCSLAVEVLAAAPGYLNYQLQDHFWSSERLAHFSQCLHESLRPRIRCAWIQILGPLLTSSVTLAGYSFSNYLFSSKNCV